MLTIRFIDLLYSEPMTQTIALIDDQDFTLKMLEGFLEKKGFKVITASNGKEGLDILNSNKVDLIICDRVMPEMSGFEMLEIIREQKSINDDTPFIFISALDDRRDKQAVSHLRPAAYIEKPVNSEKLLDVIQDVI